MKGLHKSLLGRPAIEKLGVVSISHIATVDNVDNLTPPERFPQLFEGLGKLQGCYRIKLRDGARPHALSTPRRVAIPLLRSVELEMKRMEDMVNQLSKFSPNLADETHPLRELLLQDREWVWGHPQQRAFDRIKTLHTNTPVIAHFDLNAQTILSANASSFGLGAVLQQRQASGEVKPVAFISRSMTPTEQRYAQIEKEALAFTWGCERLSDYLIGLPFSIQTGHKPLVPLFSTKNLEELPVRVQRFRMRMMRFQFSISHVPGKDLIFADALSRAPVADAISDDILLQEEAHQCRPDKSSGDGTEDRRD